MARAEELYERPCCIRGYHEYMTVWTAIRGEIIDCRREPENTKDRYAVSIIKEDTIIGHLPRSV